MKPQDRRSLVCTGFALLTVLLAGSTRGAPLVAIAEERIEPSQVVLQPLLEFEKATLTVGGPAGYVAERVFGPGEAVRLSLMGGEGHALPDGRYEYSLRLSTGSENSSEIKEGLFFIDGGSGVSRAEMRKRLASIRETLNQERGRKLRAHQQTATTSRAEGEVSIDSPSSDALSGCKRRWCCRCDGDFALGGSIIKEGFPFLHNYGGARYGNTALGLDALTSVTPAVLFDGDYDYFGSFNTAVGQQALQYNTDGNSNTAIGYSALRDSIGYSASGNTAVGHWALGNNTTGFGNTAVGVAALLRNTGGYPDLNTAVGYGALLSNANGAFNTAIGTSALVDNSGSKNTAIGTSALARNSGSENTAIGYAALRLNFTGTDNTAIGVSALHNTTGYRNVAVGHRAGFNATTGDDNIFIANEGVAGEAGSIRVGTQGTHSKTYIAGISGAAMVGSTVVVDNKGQLGVRFSARHYKETIEDMKEASSGLLALRPVTFRYKDEVIAGPKPIEFGLIAEEVAEIFPDLVTYDEEGRPFSVRYDALTPMLLNELQKQASLNQEQQLEIERLRSVEQELAAIKARLAHLEAEEEPTLQVAAGRHPPPESGSR